MCTRWGGGRVVRFNSYMQLHTCSNFLLDGSGAVAIATVAGSNSAKFLMDNVQVTFHQSVNCGEVRGWGLGEF